MNSKRKHLRIAAIFAIVPICLLLWFSTTRQPTTSQAQSRQEKDVVSQTFTVAPKGPFHGPLLKTPPARSPRRGKEGETEEREHPPSNTRIDPTVRPEDIRPMNPPSVVNLISEKDTKTAREAPGTFTFFRNNSTGDAPALPGAAPPNNFSPYEPSVGVNGRVIFYTTNNYAAVSGDRGQTFSYINPFDNFPADNVVDNVNFGFGGDQYAYYVRTHGLMCWLIQYNPDNANNTYRLAVARSQADILNNTWLVYDFTPATFGLATPPGSSGVWMDFPDLSVSDNFLYFTANYFPRRTSSTGPPTCSLACPGGGATCPAGCGTTCARCSSLGAIIARIPLANLVQGTGFSGNFFNDASHFSLRLTHGAHGTMYWGAHNSNTQIAIYRWPESTTTIPAPDNVNHAAYILNSPVRGSYVATCAGGTNYLSNEDDRIQGAWVANGVIGFMWDVAQGGGFAQPHVEVVRFDENNRSLLPGGQGQIFNAGYAYSYPSVHPNDRGHLGGTITFGCGGNSGNPGVAAWIADDFNGNTITPLENAGAVVGNRSEGRWGDYFATRIYSPFGNTWVGTGFTLNTPTARDHRFVWFGRERDMPSASNVIFVSLFNTTGYEDGTLFHPYNTIREGHLATMPGDTVSISAADYNEPQVLNRPSRLERLGSSGTVKIGP